MTGKFAAYDEMTLNELWSFNLGTPITAPPMKYSVNGKQYIAVVAGGCVSSRLQSQKSRCLKSARSSSVARCAGVS